MKFKLLLLFTVYSLFTFSQTNYNWTALPPTASGFSISDPQTTVIYNDVPYAIGYQGGVIAVKKYDPTSSTWTLMNTGTIISTSVYKVKAKVFAGKLFVVVQGTSSFESGVYFNDALGFSAGFHQSTYTGTFSNYWEFDVAPNYLFIGSINNFNLPILHVFNYSSSTWIAYDQSPTLNADNIPNLFSNNATISLYCSSSDVFFGFSLDGLGGDRLGKCPITNPPGFSGYDGTNYTIFKDGSVYEGFKMYLYGDGINPPKAMLVDEATDYSTYSPQLSVSSQLNVVTGTEPILNFSISTTDFESIYTNNYQFVVNKFGPSVSSTPVDLNFNRYDVGASIWETNTTNISNTFEPIKNSLELSLSSNGKHLGVYYEDATGTDVFFLSNTAPQINLGAASPNNGICSNNQNILIPDLQFYDDENDSIRILSITGLNIANAFAIYKNRITSVQPYILKYDIYADVLGLTPGSYQLQIEYTDGYDTITTPINYLVNASGTQAQFSQASYTFCETQPIVDMASLLNIHNGGQFTVNSHLIDGSTFNILPENWLGATSGNLSYKTFIDGCKSETFANYTTALVGVTTINTSSSNCGTPTGTADWIYVPDNAGEVPVSIEWSTGSNANNLSGLDVGQYYCDLLLPTGCRSRGYGVVLPTLTSITAAITNVSCNGGSNGAIDLTVSNGPSTYSLIWSNGYSSEDLSNLKAGTYTVALTEAGGCVYYSSFTVDEPDPIQVTFSKTQPNCGVANGDITAFPLGGISPYSYIWTINGSTVNSLTGISSGIYELVVSDANLCSDTLYPNLNDQFASTPSAQIIPTNCFLNNGAVHLTIIPDGSFPLPYISTEWSNGSSELSNMALSEGEYSVKISSGPFGINECYAFETYYVNTEKPAMQDICIVTVDLASTTNMVVWEKAEPNFISHYNIYRETNTLGEYLLIDTVNFTSETIFNDVVISPMISSWRYRMSAVNECGQEGPLSPAHKSVLMNAVNVSSSVVDILWDDYEGTADIAHYRVNRFSDQNGWEQLPGNIAIGTSTYTDNFATGLTNLDYYVETVLNTHCISEKINDFNSIRSNRERGTFAVGEGTGNSNNELNENYLFAVELYPNPTNENLHLIQLEDNLIEVTVLSINGSVVFSQKIESKNSQLNFSTLESGIYFVEMKFNETKLTKRVIKN